MIRNVRIDVNHFVKDDKWKIKLQKSKLTSLKSLRKVDLFVNTFTADVFFPAIPPRFIFRFPFLVNSVLEFPARRPSFAVVSVRRCHVYYTQDAKELAENAKIEKCLERMRKMLGGKQGAANGD